MPLVSLCACGCCISLQLTHDSKKKDSELSLVSHHKPFLCISDTCRLKSLANQRWFSVVYSLIVNDTRHHSCQNVVDSRGAPQQILTTVMTHIVVDNTIHHAKPQLIRFLPQYQRNKIFVLTIETPTRI